jgi:hypothetical protein
MAKEKTTGFFFKMSPEGWEMVERRMAQTGIQNKSAYIRKMCIDGHVINLDLKQLDEIKRLLSSTANNANQIARRVNKGYEPYREDVAEVNGQLAEVRLMFGELLTLLSDFASAKPGKLFIPPPKITDYQPEKAGA